MVGTTDVVVVVGGGSVVVDVGGGADVVVVVGGGSVVVGGLEGGATVATADDGPTSVEVGEGSDGAAVVAAAAAGGAADPEGPATTAAAWAFDGGLAVRSFFACDTDELGLAVSGKEACSTPCRAIVSGCSEARDGMTWGAMASWLPFGGRRPPMSWPPK